MPLVQMHKPRIDAQRRERAHATDAEQRVLREARDRIRDIQLRGDPPLKTTVPRHISVEQEQRHPADSHPPDLSPHLPPTNRQRNHQRPPVNTAHQGRRKPLGIDINPVLLLPAGHLQALTEIPLAVHQPDRDQRQRAIRSLLEKITRQATQPTRIDRQRPVHPELGAEERDRPLRHHRPHRPTPHSHPESVLQRSDTSKQTGITRRPRKRLTGHLLQEANRVLVTQLPATRID